MIGLQSGEEKIGERIGWSRDKIKKNVELCLHVGPEILKFAKENQNGCGPTIGPAGPKNEREVNKLARKSRISRSAAKKTVRQRLAQLHQYVNERSRIGTEIQNFAKWSKKTVYQRLVHMYQFVNARS